MKSAEEFGQWLKAARRARRLRQVELANLAGCNSAYISHLETGHRMPSRRLQSALESALGESPPKIRASITESLKDAVLAYVDAVIASGVASPEIRITTYPDGGGIRINVQGDLLRPEGEGHDDE